MSRDIRILGDPILRKTARPMSGAWTPRLRRLVTEMLESLRLCGGVGIAAPQVGESLRLVILASHPTARYPDAPNLTPRVLFNPEITGHSPEGEMGWEGCLSVPGQRGRVRRACSVRVLSVNPENGAPEHHVFDGFLARILQHEVDHLDGVLFPDRVSEPEDLVSEAEYQAILRQARP